LLQVEPDGRLVLGDEEGLWHGDPDVVNWTPTGPPLNKMMITCFVHTEGVWLACTTTYSTKFLGAPRGVWRSTDGGNRWRRTSLPDLSVTLLAVDPSVPGTVAAFALPDSGGSGVGHGGIWVSRDSGRTWRRVNTTAANSLQPIGLALVPGHPFTLLFATTAGFDRSTDGGRHWTVEAALGNGNLSIVVSPKDPRVVFAGSTDGVWKSTDAGAHWRLYWSGPPTSDLVPAYDRVDDLYGFASVNHPYLYRMLDCPRCKCHAGSPCVEELRGTVPRTSGQLQMSVDPTDASRVYAAWSFPLRIYESKDSGKIWREIL